MESRAAANMSGSSSSPASSPPNRLSHPKAACVECRRLKRGCDKQMPCGSCLKSNRECDYRDPSDDGIFSPVHSAKNIDSLAYGTLMGVIVNKHRAQEAVSAYFEGVNSWFPIFERTTFEKHLDDKWGSLSAEASVLTLCMVLVSRPPNQKPSKGMGDSVYVTTKMMLTAVESKIGITMHLLQAELLVAVYEFSQGMRQQAWQSVGRCLDRAKALGWLAESFWTVNPAQRPTLGKLKLCSILFWAVVHVDCLLYVGYEDSEYPLLTAGLFPDQIVPLPESFDRYLSGNLPFQYGGQGEELPNANSDFLGGMAFPEAKSAMNLNLVLRHLLNPALGTQNREHLSRLIWDHTKTLDKLGGGDRHGAVGTNLIALLKLHYPGLFSGIGPMPLSGHDQALAVRRMGILTRIVHGRAEKLAAAPDERLTAGAVAPCWAFALCYAARLLIHHGDGVLQDAAWLSKVGDMKGALDRIAKRWKIAEKYCERVRIDLEHRLAASAGLN